MVFYFAPMEGLTGHIYRTAHQAFYGGITKYFAPFIVAHQSERLKPKALTDVLPENNSVAALIPQLLTNNAEDFNNTADRLQQLGYEEINLNLGCPSGTVVSKGRGAGFLAHRDALNAFLEAIYAHTTVKISIKTRLGKETPEEIFELLHIFNKYPVSELIIHARVQTDMYKNTPNWPVFREALAKSTMPVCYNGDIFSMEDFKAFNTAFPHVQTLMLGRGLIKNPGLAETLAVAETPSKDKLRQFHDKILRDYETLLFGDRNVLFKMKAIWAYMHAAFSESAPHLKKINKSQKLSDYRDAVSRLFWEQELV